MLHAHSDFQTCAMPFIILWFLCFFFLISELWTTLDSVSVFIECNFSHPNLKKMVPIQNLSYQMYGCIFRYCQLETSTLLLGGSVGPNFVWTRTKTTMLSLHLGTPPRIDLHSCFHFTNRLSNMKNLCLHMVWFCGIPDNQLLIWGEMHTEVHTDVHTDVHTNVHIKRVGYIGLR